MAKSTGQADGRQQLLKRILASRQFAHAHSLKRILWYVCDHSGSPDQDPPKEYDIAVHSMGRPKSFDPRSDPIVRVSMASIRDRLLAYFATEGKEEPLRLTIPKGHYRAVFCEPSAERPPEEHERRHALSKFWDPYLSHRLANIVVYTEPLFFRDDHGRFVRDLYVNDPSGGLDQLKKRFPAADTDNLTPSYHYLSAGEVHCLLSLSRMFHDLGVPIETRNSRISSWNELRLSNLILLGSPRTNTFLDSLQGENCFVVAADRIENGDPRRNEQTCYRGARYMDGKLPRMTDYAVVTRRPGLTSKSSVTTIAANHGRAIEGAGHLLTLENRVQALLESMGLDGADLLPEHFQMLMRVDMIDVDDEVAQVECVAYRILSG